MCRCTNIRFLDSAIALIGPRASRAATFITFFNAESQTLCISGNARTTVSRDSRLSDEIGT